MPIDDTPAADPAGPVADVCAGAALGALLGFVIGSTTSPVASTVASALVALLGAFFGFSERLGADRSGATARRLGAFALAAAVVVPASIWVRTHELLGVSTAEQRQRLEEIGIHDPGEQRDLLRYLRFGLLPAGGAAAAAGSGVPPAGTAIAVGAPMLYAAPTGFCAEYAGLRALRASADDVATLFAGAGGRLARLGAALSALPPESRLLAYAAVGESLCAR